MSKTDTDVCWSSKEGEITMELNSWIKLHREDELELFFDGQLNLDDRRGKEGHAEAGNI